MRPIDADELKDHQFHGCYTNIHIASKTDAYMLGWNDAINAVVECAPTVDAEPVVRCKDCKHFAGEGMYCAQDIIVQYDHFYCYHGEREDDVPDTDVGKTEESTMGQQNEVEE